MKTFEIPEIVVVNFDVEDVVTASSETPEVGGFIGDNCIS